MDTNTQAEYRTYCQSLVGTSQPCNGGDTVKVLKHWVSARGKDFFWIEIIGGKRLDVESWYITDAIEYAIQAAALRLQTGIDTKTCKKAVAMFPFDIEKQKSYLKKIATI